MKKYNAAVVGLIYGFSLSFFCAFIFMLFGQLAAGGGAGPLSLFGEGWLYLAIPIPLSLGFMILGNYLQKQSKLTDKKHWLISIVFVFFVSLIIGTFGTLLGESLVRGGMETVIIDSTFIWGTIYAFVLLPFTTILARLLIHGFVHLLIKLKALDHS